mmetsp:Transcript_63611/g.88432  ORF Transcript_63611/g.88432 Transcript_63611/m.88432 type:complete len:197 (+) Transcript_63611:119-709(+)
MMASNDPLKPVPGAELTPEPLEDNYPDPISEDGTAKPSPMQKIKKKLPEVVGELKRTNERLTKENAKVESGVDDLNLKFAAAGVRLWGQLVKLRNDIATGTLKVIAKLDAPNKSKATPPTSANVETTTAPSQTAPQQAPQPAATTTEKPEVKEAAVDAQVEPSPPEESQEETSATEATEETEKQSDEPSAEPSDDN